VQRKPLARLHTVLWLFCIGRQKIPRGPESPLPPAGGNPGTASAAFCLRNANAQMPKYRSQHFWWGSGDQFVIHKNRESLRAQQFAQAAARYYRSDFLTRIRFLAGHNASIQTLFLPGRCVFVPRTRTALSRSISGFFRNLGPENSKNVSSSRTPRSYPA
jgi:hypothetical protein